MWNHETVPRMEESKAGRGPMDSLLCVPRLKAAKRWERCFGEWRGVEEFGDVTDVKGHDGREKAEERETEVGTAETRNGVGGRTRVWCGRSVAAGDEKLG